MDGLGSPGRVEPRLSRLESEYTAVSGETASPSLFPLVLNNPMLFLGLDGICQHHESLLICRLESAGWSWKSAVGVTGNATVMIYCAKGDTCSLYTILKVQKRASGEKSVLLLCSHPPLELLFIYLFI